MFRQLAASAPVPQNWLNNIRTFVADLGMLGINNEGKN
jgi:hypothetical protein